MLDVQAELHEHGQPYHELYEAVGELKRRHDLHPCAVQPRDGLSLRTDGERERVQDLVSRFRKLPEDTRRRLPALPPARIFLRATGRPMSWSSVSQISPMPPRAWNFSSR